MEVLISSEKIQARVAAMADEISCDYAGRRLTIVGVLTGCIMLLADLVRHLTIPVRIGVIQASSYRREATVPGPLQIQQEIEPDLRDRDVLLLDDILDTGQTLHTLAAMVRGKGAASVKIAVLLRKEGRQVVPLEPDYCGFSIPNVFVVGYGLDFNDEHRQLPFIGVLP